jgi:hypothetical protein
MADPNIQAPSPDATPQEIFDYLTSVDPATANQWIESNLSTMPAATFDEVRNRVRIANSGATTGMYGGRTEPGSLRAIEEQLSVRGEASAERNRTDRQKEQAVDQLVEQGVDEQTAEQQIDQAFDDDFVVVPDILARGSGFNGQPSRQEQAQLIETWNEFYPDQPVTNFQELATRVNQGKNNPTVQQVVDYAFGGGAEPVIEYKYEFGATRQYLPNGQVDYASLTPQQSVRVSATQFDALQKAYGGDFGHKDLKQFALMANQIGLKDASGNNGWQIMAAIAAGLGFFDLGENVERAVPGPGPVRTGSGPVDLVLGREQKQNEGRNQRITAREMEQLRKRGLAFKEGLTLYGQNDALAYLHSVNPTLATTIANTGPNKPVNPSAAKKANQLFLNSGFDQGALQAMGYFSLGIQDYFDYQQGMEQSQASGPVRQLPDSEAIRQSAKDLWVQLYAKDPSDQQLDKIVSSVTSAILSADIDGSDGTVQDVNASAQLRRAVESAPEYQDLYGNKPGGMSEAEYQGQFRAGAQSILGNQAADPEIVRSGMRTGQFQTSVGAAAVSSQALDNSTWLGRLANASQLVSANT